MHFKFIFVDNYAATYIPIEYDGIINDHVFRNNAMTSKVNFSDILNALEKVEGNVNEVIIQIDEELKNN